MVDPTQDADLAERMAELKRSLSGSLEGLIGQRIGKYLIRRELGRGGMGVVFEAEDTVLRRPVAIKLIYGRDDDEQLLRRFLREASAAARLNHPNVVAVYEADWYGEVVYIAMELVRGGSTSDHLRQRGPFTWQDATRIMIEVCHGLEAVHSAGLVHRDLKPENIVVAQLGEISPQPSRLPLVKVADFGLSKVTGASSTTLTEMGSVVGTPQFMSPEQIRGQEVDARSDVYSAGATYFTLLTGNVPYPGEDPMQVLFAHCNAEVPDASQIRSSVPNWCSQVILRAMAKAPGDRYQSVTELEAALHAALAESHRANTEVLAVPEQVLAPDPHPTIELVSGQTEAMPAPPVTRTNRFLWAAMAIFAAAVVGMVVVTIFGGPWSQNPPEEIAGPGRSTSPAAVEASTDAPPPVRTTLSLPDAAASLSAEELRALHHAAGWLEEAEIQESLTKVIRPAGEINRMLLSQDRSLLVWGDAISHEGLKQVGHVVVADAASGEVLFETRKDRQFTGINGLAVAQNNRAVFYSISNKVFAFLIPLQKDILVCEIQEGGATNLAVSPQLDLLAVSVKAWAKQDGRVELYDLKVTESTATATNRRRVVYTTAKPVQSVSISPDGKWMAATTATGEVTLADGRTGMPRDTIQMPPPPTDGDFLGYAVEFSPDGKRLAIVGDKGLVLWNIADKKRRNFPRVHRRRILTASFSPDGKMIASASDDSVRLWSLTSGKQIGRSLLAHNGNLVVIAGFLSQPGRMVTSSFDNTIRFWDFGSRLERLQ